MDGRDYISHLPDELLLIILSKLNIVEGARTTVLSKRWRRNLWAFSTPILRFDASDFMPCYTSYFNSYDKQYPNVPINNRLDRILHQTLPRYTGLVLIDELHIYYLPSRFGPPKIRPWRKVDSWVEFAKTKFVKKLDLSFELFDDHDFYSPPPLKSLTSTTFFPLVSLRLKYPPSLSNQLFDSLLSSFPNLEDLSVTESTIHDSSLLSLVTITEGSSLKLKHLELIGLHIGELLLSAPNLISFNFVAKKLENRYTRMHLSSVPLLAHLSYDEYNYSDDSVTEMGAMPNLKILNITLGEAGDEALRLLFRFLEASPCLSKLSLNLEFISCPVIPNDQLIAMNQCLEEVEIYGFYGFDNEVQLVSCIAQFSPSLKKITIHPN
ncbi:F-box protein At1g80960 [Euphorbia peplus]|nr:F-box protein At1g80960 [Euphorbia peplus]